MSWTGVAASELLIQRVRFYDDLADRRQPDQLRRWACMGQHVSSYSIRNFV